MIQRFLAALGLHRCNLSNLDSLFPLRQHEVQEGARALDVGLVRGVAQCDVHALVVRIGVPGPEHAATAGVKWSVIGQFENVARKGDRGPVPSHQAAKKTMNQRDIEEDD